MNSKIVCFAGHRFDFQNIGIEQKLKETIIDLIKNGYTIFYDGGKGYFDNICSNIVINLKKIYPQIKIYRILSHYNYNKEKGKLPSCYNGSIMPEIEHFHPKIRITKKKCTLNF